MIELTVESTFKLVTSVVNTHPSPAFVNPFAVSQSQDHGVFRVLYFLPYPQALHAVIDLLKNNLRFLKL